MCFENDVGSEGVVQAERRPRQDLRFLLRNCVCGNTSNLFQVLLEAPAQVRMELILVAADGS